MVELQTERLLLRPFRASDLDGIASGEITLAFRRWDKPRVKPGGSQRTRIGLVAFDAVSKAGRVSNRPTSPL